MREWQAKVRLEKIADGESLPDTYACWHFPTAVHRATLDFFDDYGPGLPEGKKIVIEVHASKPKGSGRKSKTS